MKKTPTTKEIYNNLSSSLRFKLGIVDLPLKKNLNVLASVFSAFFKLTYLYLTDIQKNSFPDTADSEETGGTLEHWGRIYLGREPNKATKGIFKIKITSEIGTTISIGSGFKTTENSKNPGQLYLLEAEVTTTATEEEIEVTSDGEGSDFYQEVGDEFKTTQPIIGIGGLQYLESVKQQSLDDESLDDYRVKVLDALRLEPQGGSKGDYREWSRDAGGVRTVYPYLKESDAGVIQIYTEATVNDSSDGEGTPTQAILDDVAAVIESNPDTSIDPNKRARRPIQAFTEVLPIEISTVKVYITGLRDDSNAIRNAIESNLNTYLEGVRPFVDGLDLVEKKNDILYLANLQQVTQSVLTNGNFFLSFRMEINDEDKNIHTFVRENIPHLRNVSYV